MKRGALLIMLLAAICSTSGAFALKVGKAVPKITVHRPCSTQLVVYDARPELGIATADVGKTARDAIANLGVRLVRHTLQWNKMETTDKPGLYDSNYLNKWDALVEECRKQGIRLVVAIEGDPRMVNAESAAQAYGRLARFAADMAGRYPSVTYWEPLGENDPFDLATPVATDPSIQRGRTTAEMMRVVYPAIKAANPAAWVLCQSGIREDQFAREFYEKGGGVYYDILDVHAQGSIKPSAFVDGAEHVRRVMEDYGDQTKPIWCTLLSTDDTGTQQYEGYFQKNNELYLYQKVIVPLELGDSDAVQSPLYKYLDDNDMNRAILDKPTNATNILVSTKVPMVPVGYDYKPVGGGIEIQRVVVDTLLPTKIDLMFVAEPSSPKPGEQPAPPERKGTRPIPDPWSP